MLCQEGVGQRIAELAALMDRAGRFGCCMTRNAAGKGELPEKAAHPFLILGHFRVEFAISALKPAVRDDAWRPVPWPGDKEDADIPCFDDPIEMDIDKAKPRRGPPMAEQAGFDMLDLQRLLQKGVIKKINLSNGKIVGRAPPSVHQCKLIL